MGGSLATWTTGRFGSLPHAVWQPVARRRLPQSFGCCSANPRSSGCGNVPRLPWTKNGGMVTLYHPFRGQQCPDQEWILLQRGAMLDRPFLNWLCSYGGALPRPTIIIRWGVAPPYDNHTVGRCPTLRDVDLCGGLERKMQDHAGCGNLSASAMPCAVALAGVVRPWPTHCGGGCRSLTFLERRANAPYGITRHLVIMSDSTTPRLGSPGPRLLHCERLGMARSIFYSAWLEMIPTVTRREISYHFQPFTGSYRDHRHFFAR